MSRSISHHRAAAVVVALLAVAGDACAAAVPVEGVVIARRYPHSTDAFTEGLFFRDGNLVESTGLEGRSVLRETRLADGALVRSVALPPGLFGEGSVGWKQQIISVTWRSEVGFRWRASDFRRIGRFGYRGEGWGLTRNDRDVIMSDGTPTLRFFDPATFRERRRITVTADGQPVANLNELEWVRGDILANIWMTGRIARIDPRTGVVKAWIDLAPVVAAAAQVDPDNVPNGIAYDARHDRLVVTGKRWPYLYEIRLTPPATH